MLQIKTKMLLSTSLTKSFALKTGSIVTIGKNCYQTHPLISTLFKYYYVGPAPFVLIFLFLLMPHWFDNLYLQAMETILLYLIAEWLLTLLLPLYRVDRNKSRH